MRRRDQRVAFHEQLKARLLAVPGVTASTVASAAPFSPAGRRQLTSVDGRPTTDPPPDVMTVVVEPAYFHTVVRGLVLGESFSELHGTPGHEAAIVNQRFAEVYLGAGSPIGRHLELRPPTAQRTYLREADAPCAAGVAWRSSASLRTFDRSGDAVPMVYLPFRAEAPAAVTLIVRGSGGSCPVVAAVRDAVNAIDPDLALGVVRTLDELRDRSRAGPADMASQFAKIGGLALVFSGVGLYSAMAYAVRRRTQEIAVRMALGAQATQVRWLFLKTGAWVIAGRRDPRRACRTRGRSAAAEHVRAHRGARPRDAHRDGRPPRDRCAGRVDRPGTARDAPRADRRIADRVGIRLLLMCRTPGEAPDHTTAMNTAGRQGI